MAAIRWTLCSLLLMVVAGLAAAGAAEDSDEQWEQVGLRATSNDTICQAAGRFCLSCDTLGLCVEAHPGDFVQYVVEKCAGNSSCSESLKSCSELKETWCRAPEGRRQLQCQDAGLWPDPFDCNVYWKCGVRDPPESDYEADARLVCRIGWAFDPRTSNCSLPENEATCGPDEYPLPPCDPAKVTAGPSARDPNLYYVCVGGSMRLFRCREGYVYDGVTWECKPDDGSSNPPPANVTASPTPPPANITTTPSNTTMPGPGFYCPSVGRFPDPDGTCYRYYECADTARPLLAACTVGKYFNREEQRCKLGSCPY